MKCQDLGSVKEEASISLVKAETTGTLLPRSKFCSLPMDLLKIGPWVKTSLFCGDLNARFCYEERVICLEIFSTASLIYKMEIPFLDICSFGLETVESSTVLSIATSSAPRFYYTHFQPHKAMSWSNCGDFTAGHASLYRRYSLHFGVRFSNTTLDLLLQREPHLRDLAQKGLKSSSEGLLFSASSALKLEEVSLSSSTPTPSSPESTLSVGDSFSDFYLDGPSSSDTDFSIGSEQEFPAETTSNFWDYTALLSLPEEPTTCAKQFLSSSSRELNGEFLEKKAKLSCCEDSPTYKELLSEYRCKCGDLHFFSFCWDTVVRSKNTSHCKACKQCRDQRLSHCPGCNQCKEDLPCSNCQKASDQKVQEYSECHVQ